MPGTPDLPHRFGRALKMLRAGQGLSQEALAGAANLSRNYIGDIERGKRCPSICAVDAMATALGMRAHELLRAADELSGWGKGVAEPQSVHGAANPRRADLQ